MFIPTPQRLTLFVYRSRWLVLSCGMLLSAAAAADTDSQFAKRLDPTDFRSRIELRNRFQETQRDGLRNVLTPRLEYAFSKGFALRLELPVVVHDARDPGVSTQGGMGDVSVRASFRLLRTDSFALIAGTEFLFDTATDTFLGSAHHSIGPFLLMSLNAPAIHSTLFPFLQSVHSFAGDAGRDPLNYTLARLFVLTRWPALWYSGSEIAIYIDHEHRGRAGNTLELEMGRFLNKHVALWARPGIGAWGNDVPMIYKWNMEVGLRYLFD